MKQAILHYEAMCMIKSNSTGFLYYKKTLREALKLAGGLARGNTLIPEVLEVYSKGICAGYLLSAATCDGRVYTKWFSNHDEAYALLQRIEQQEILVAELL